MASATTVHGHHVIKMEDSPEPEDATPQMPPPQSAATASTTAQPIDRKDPDSFLKRCAGYNKKKGVRCSAPIGRNSQHSKNSHPTYLPTCHAHKDQLNHAGWCQFMQEDGERCSRLFRWTPPYLELCDEHRGHPDTPCYFLGLPLELRLDIFRYLIPSQTIGSSTALVHAKVDEKVPEPRGLYRPRAQDSFRALRRGQSLHEQTTTASLFETPLLNLLLVNKQMCSEVKDLLLSTVSFTIDVRKDGTFMCGRRLLEPRRADGSSHAQAEGADWLKTKFLRTFDWAAAKNYDVDILVENCHTEQNAGCAWDEEVEIYDIRDYLNVVVSGILGKSRNLCKLNVRLGISRFEWSGKELLDNIKLLLGPFERLRNVRQPRLSGVYNSASQTPYVHVLSLPLPMKAGHSTPGLPPCTPISSVPSLATDRRLSICDEPPFHDFRANWQRWICAPSSSSLVHRPPIFAMFTEFREFYTKLAALMPDILHRPGRHAFLHRVRVARETENVDAFRLLRNELIECWYTHIEQEERKKDDMNKRLSKLLDADVYPSSWDEDSQIRKGSASTSSAPGSNAQSPHLLNAETMKGEGSLFQGNAVHHENQLHETHHQRRRQELMEIARMHQQQPQYEFHPQSRQLAEAQAQQLAQVQLQQLTLAQRANLQRPIVHPGHPQSSQMGMSADQAGTIDEGQRSIAQSALPPQDDPTPITAITTTQTWKTLSPTSQATIMGDGTDPRSSSSSSSSPATTFSPTTTTLSSNPFTPPTPTHQVQFGRDVIGNSWNGWYEENEKSGESSKPYGPHLFATAQGRPTAPNNAPTQMHPSILANPMQGPKRRRTTSSTDRGNVQVNENGDEIMIIDENYVDPFSAWAHQQEQFVGKGKGKAAASDERVEAQPQEFASHWVRNQGQTMQTREAELMGMGNARAPIRDPDVVWLE